MEISNGRGPLRFALLANRRQYGADIRLARDDDFDNMILKVVGAWGF